MEILGIPETLPRETVVEFFKSIGLDPSRCVSVVLRADGIYAEVFALDKEGNKIIDTQHGEVVLHNVFVQFN